MSSRTKAIIGGLVVLALIMVGIAQLTGGDDGGDGGSLALGETAVVEYTKVDDAGKLGSPTMLAVTVTEVRAGTRDELTKAGFEIDDEGENSTPYYIDARYENRGQVPVKKGIDVHLEDSDGESLPSTLLFDFGDKGFKPCQPVTEGSLAPGESYESCTLVLVPEDSDVGKVLFVSQKANSEIVFTRWDAPAS
jgi:hypothetical protein